MIFESPWAFGFIPVTVLIFIIIILKRRNPDGVFFSSSYPLSVGIKSLRQRIIWLPAALLFLGCLLLITALARPRERLDETKKVTNGVAIEFVIDRSGSMAAEVENRGSFTRRIDIVKQNMLDFINGDGETLSGRPDDLIGLIAFARYADTLAPLSLSHDVLKDFTSGLDVVTTREEDGTSIGDALALAAARLKTAGENNDPDKGYDITSRIIILLTDGESNAGNYTPREAAALAAQWGVRIYAIGFGGTAYYETDGLFGKRKIPVGASVDEASLREIAEITGGIYFEADSAEELGAVYEEIDKLEKTEIVSFTEYKYRELFVSFALAAILFLAAGLILDSTIFRRLP
ncbi:MAG: VWA domain-containing protein [Spirochaetales bacterium]|uniref:VWA domain-containing protein n=1 Tax=Candidatus Thalassospirochaeta sargassi TaxID=3119039 RepID=A0AAJ1IFZ5_9SPIO|nr:VWA domain-containing protein [Spirochaetales bacterium]